MVIKGMCGFECVTGPFEWLWFVECLMAFHRSEKLKLKTLRIRAKDVTFYLVESPLRNTNRQQLPPLIELLPSFSSA